MRNMQTSLSLSRLLGYNDFFPNHQPKAKEIYAKNIGSEKLKQFSAHFLSFSKRGNTKSVEQLIAEWFTFNDEHRFLQSPAYFETISAYNRIKRFHIEQHSIISVESLLNLFLWLHEQYGLPNETAADASVTISLFDINLVFNNDVIANYERAVKIIEPYKDDRHIQRLTLAMSFPQSDLLNIDYGQLLYTQFYKALRLLDFMESTAKYHALFGALLEHYGCSSKEEFIKGIGLAVVLGIKGKFKWNVLNVEINENYEKSCSFLDKIAVTQDYDARDEQDDYLQLRSRPIEKIAGGQYRVIFDLFLIKKMYNGLLFTLSDLTNNNTEFLKGSFFGNIRLDFSEKVLLYEVMQEVYGQTMDIQYNGTQLNAAELDREPDYYIREGNSILLMESKDFFMKGSIKLSYDFLQIEAELRKDGRLGKAVKQLACNIKRALNKEFPDTSYSPSDVYIYPIIVTYDSLYNCAGLNYWVHFWLKEELIGLDTLRVKPVTILDIDSLIIYQDQLRNKELNLSELLREFHATVDYERQHIEDTTKHAYQSCIPFSEFLTETAIKQNIEPDSRLLNALLTRYNIS